jgi:hypothetical protein
MDGQGVFPPPTDFPSQAMWTSESLVSGISRLGTGMSLTFFNSAPFHLRTIFVNAGLPDCPESGQSGTGIKKNEDAGTCQVPDPVPD